MPLLRSRRNVASEGHCWQPPWPFATYLPNESHLHVESLMLFVKP